MTTTTVATVGGEIDSWCGRCKLLLVHKVVAKIDAKVRRVECLTCHEQHAFRAAAPKQAEPKPAVAPPKRRATPRAAVPVDDGRPAKPYLATAAYAANEYIEHEQYGRGRVVTARKDKIDVTFGKEAKILIHRRRALI